MATWQFWLIILLIYMCVYMITDSFKYYVSIKYGCKGCIEDFDDEE
jgi:hypothetical protein